MAKKKINKKDIISSLLKKYWKDEISDELDYDKWYQRNLWFHGVSVSIGDVPKLRKYIEDKVKDAIKFERRRVRRLKKRVSKNHRHNKDIQP